MNETTLAVHQPAPGLLSPASSFEDHTPAAEAAATDLVCTRRRKPIPRKGHTKSRNGCIQCKRRKVKCQETQPGCANCRRLGLVCEYPVPQTPTRRDATSPAPTTALQSTGGQFTMEDLQFFRHFLFHAYPPLPLKSDAVWHEIASLSHHFDFLIHAMLGLAASHLSLSNNVDYKAQALTHRISAIESFNKALSKPCMSKAEADALYGTVMALAFQSSYMLDGMLEFVSMIRGCIIVSGLSMERFAESLFGCFTTERHIEQVQEINGGYCMPTEYTGFLDAALVSLKALQPLCRSVLELRYLLIIDNIIKAAKSSSVDGFLEVSMAYNTFGDSTTAEFNGFVEPDNYVAQIILVHFFIVEFVVGLEALQSVMDSFPFRGSIVASWTKEVEGKLPPEYKHYMTWPMSYVRSVEAETLGLTSLPKTIQLGRILADNPVELE
ncbi:hypothetical protein BGZ63DRAFT_473155 [Mariannaea sp. PMI_226]|nr:hypothetical protein BGZ63DRAFT_473155 [Mariannaea sp. PMI_226]